MRKSVTFRALAAMLSALAALVSCSKVYEEPGDSTVNAALQIKVSSVTAASATVSITVHGEDISSLMYVPAKKYPAEVDYLSMSSIKRLEYVKEHGVAAEYPFSRKENSLDPDQSYSVAAFGLNAQGVITTAPAFLTFKSGSAVTDITADYIGEVDGKFKFTYSMTPNEYVESYRYIVTNDPAIVNLTDDEVKAYLRSNGSGVETSSDAVSKTITNDEKKDLLVATLSYDELERECTFRSEIASTKSVVYFVMDDVKTKLERVGTDETVDIFDGTFDVKAQSQFIFNINKVDYGFRSFSGNGGVGQNECEFTSAPYYYAKKFIDNKTHSNVNFYIRESLGRLETIENGGNKLWVNQTSDGKIYVRVDLTAKDGTPRYYVKWVEENPSVVLMQNFDLCSYGGYYMIKYAASSSTLYPAGANAHFSTVSGLDGTQPGEKAAGNGTALGIYRSDWPTLVSTGAELATAEYMKNKGLSDWTLLNFCEQSGVIILGNGNFKGRATTPLLTNLTGATDITLEYDTIGYGNNTDDFAIIITGAGKFTSCSAKNADGVSVMEGVTEKEVSLPSGTIKTYGTTDDVQKEYTHITAKIEGADATTQITFAFDVVATANNKSRSLLDNVLITK